MSSKTLPTPADAASRRAAKPTIVYPASTMPRPDMAVLDSARHTMVKVHEVVVPPRDARAFRVSRGQFFRIVSIEGPQVGDLGAGIHDVIGTRCDPYTNLLLSGTGYDFCCHSNLSRALAVELKVEPCAVEHHIHDVLNVFMCTGFTKDTHQYFMKASPVRPGDFIEFFAEIDLLGALSACPGGDCSATHSSDVAACYPLKIEIFEPDRTTLGTWTWPSPSEYHRRHGTPA